MSEDIQQRLREQYEQEREMQEEAQGQETAASMAGNPNLLNQVNDPAFLEVLGDADISRDQLEDDLDDELATELSRWHMLAYLDDEEYERERDLVANQVDRWKSEHPQQRGPGSKCSGEYRAIMTGEKNPKPVMTDEMARRYDSAGEVKKRMLSLSRGAKAFDGLTQIQSVVQTIRDKATGGSGGNDNDDDSGGRKSTLGRIASRFGRGS